MLDISRLPIAIESARKLYERGGTGHDFDHVLRVLALAQRIAEAEGANVAVVSTSALLHDVGASDGRSDHHIRGAAMAREILRDQPVDFVEAVAHAIEAHRFRSEPAPRTLEAQVLSDADKLDAIGAIGVARVFAHAGARGTALWRVPWREIAATEMSSSAQWSHAGELGRTQVGSVQAAPLDADAAPKALGAAYTPVHEFVYKLDQIPERLYTKTARAMAVERQKFMRAFFDRLDEEMIG